MPKALTADELLNRAEQAITTAEQMIEPEESRAHGGWMKRQQSLLGHADDDLRHALKRKSNQPPGAIQQRWAELNARCDRRWTYFKSRLRN